MNSNQIVSENFVTEEGVNLILQNYIGTPGAGTVTSVGAGSGLSATPSPITSSGTISLDANLKDLNDVNYSSASVNEVLTWNGTCWYPAMFSGSGTSPIAFTDLSDTPSTLQNNYLLESTSNSIILTENNYFNNVTNGPGINSLREDSNSVRLEVDLTQYTTTTTSTENDQFVILQDELGGGLEPRLITQGNIHLENFKNAETYVENIAKGSLTATLPIVYDSINGTIGLSGSVMTGIDFNNYPINGVLPIENGGTCASTSFDARVNLGLSYNTDILAFEDPYYNGFMRGTNVRYAPGTATIEIVHAGTGYDGVGNFINYNGKNIFLNVITGSDGEICSASLQGNNYDTLLYSGMSIQVHDSSAGSNTGYVNVIPEISYINFGLSQGSDGIGFRNNEGSIEYKSTGPSWLQFETFISTITGMNDVDFSPTGNNILVYQSGKYTSKVLTGNLVTISGDQVSISGPIDPQLIITSGDSITIPEFTTLQGISSNIQTQLNNKVESLNTPSDTAILYYDSSSGSSGWNSLNANNDDDGKVLTIDFSSGMSGVVWKNPFVSVGSSMIPDPTSTHDIGTSSARWKNTFTDILNLGIYDASTPPEGICGSLAVFSNGNYGSPCLGLYWGTSWNIIGMSGSIQSS